MPEGGRVLRRERRRAWRGTPTGRRSTHTVETAYGRKQKARDWLAARQAANAAAATEHDHKTKEAHNHGA
jgi:hypothetical protein